MIVLETRGGDIITRKERGVTRRLAGPVIKARELIRLAQRRAGRDGGFGRGAMPDAPRRGQRDLVIHDVRRKLSLAGTFLCRKNKTGVTAKNVRWWDCLKCRWRVSCGNEMELRWTREVYAQTTPFLFADRITSPAAHRIHCVRKNADRQTGSDLIPVGSVRWTLDCLLAMPGTRPPRDPPIRRPTDNSPLGSAFLSDGSSAP